MQKWKGLRVTDPTTKAALRSGALQVINKSAHAGWRGSPDKVSLQVLLLLYTRHLYETVNLRHVCWQVNIPQQSFAPGVPGSMLRKLAGVHPSGWKRGKFRHTPAPSACWEQKVAPGCWHIMYFFSLLWWRYRGEIQTCSSNPMKKKSL